MLLNIQEITEEIKEEIKETNDNDNTNMMTWSLWDAAMTILRGELIAIQFYLKKREIHQINNQNLHLKQPQKE